MGADEWSAVAERSAVSFRCRTYWGLYTVKGQFTQCEGWLSAVPSPRLELRVRAASIDTGNAKRDEHLRSGDFFGVETHPEVIFVCDDLVETANGFVACGDLTIAGHVSRHEVPAQLELLSATRARLHARLEVDRTSVGLAWNGAGGMIKNRVVVEIDAELAAE
jgi:polyisoprenoid-binding protein YceI